MPNITFLVMLIRFLWIYIRNKVFDKQSEKTRNQGVAKSNSMPEIRPSQEVKKVVNM